MSEAKCNCVDPFLFLTLTLARCLRKSLKSFNKIANRVKKHHYIISDDFK